MSIPLIIRPRTREQYKRILRQLLDTRGTDKYIPERAHRYNEPPFELQVQKTKGGLKTITLVELENEEKKILKMISYLAYVMELVRYEGIPFAAALYSYVQVWDVDGNEYAVTVSVNDISELRLVSLGIDGGLFYAYFSYRGAPDPDPSEMNKEVTDVSDIIPW